MITLQIFIKNFEPLKIPLMNKDIFKCNTSKKRTIRNHKNQGGWSYNRTRIVKGLFDS